MAEAAPLVRKLQYQAPAVATATTSVVSFAEAPFAATVTDCTYSPNAAITGANTNTRQIQLINKGAAGVGTTVVATIQFNAGVNGVAFDEMTVTLSVVAGATTVAEGDILAWASNSIGTGLADPGGLVQIDLTRST